MPASPTDFLFAERRLQRFYATEVEFYETLHEVAGRLVTADAFYLCLVQRTPEGLHFVYNREGDRFDVPEALPLGGGPTSRVVREGRPVVLLVPEDGAGLAFPPPADRWNACASAVHWPLWIDVTTDGPPDAVLGVQAYPERAYDAEALDCVAWLAHRTEAAMRRRNREAAGQRAAEAAALDASRNQAVADARRFVALLEGIVELRHDPARLLAEIRHRQVEVVQLAPLVPVASDELRAALDGLSDRVLEVLVHVAQGCSNGAVAEALMCSRHTVKRHLDGVYRDTPLRNRKEVAGAAATVRELYVARMGGSKVARPGD